MQNEGATQKILSALEQAALNHHIDIVDVEIVGSSKNPVVRVRIDHDDEKAETISLDEVAQETSWISETIGMLSSIALFSPRLNLTRGVFKETFAGIFSADE